MRRLNVISLGFHPFTKFFFRHFGLFFGNRNKLILINMIMRPAKSAVVLVQALFSLFLFDYTQAYINEIGQPFCFAQRMIAFSLF